MDSRASGLSSCGIGLSCPMACGILAPQPGIEPTSPTLEGGFLTTGPLEKSPFVFSQRLGRASLWEFEFEVSDFPIILAFLLEK